MRVVLVVRRKNIRLVSVEKPGMICMRHFRTISSSILLLAASGVWADEQVSTMSRSGLLQSQTAILDGRAAQQYANSVRLQPPREDGLAMLPRYTGSYRGPFLDVARRAATRHSVPADLFLRLVQQESGWNPNARSSKGALGLAQLMPDTARALGVNPLNPDQNLDGGARYLREQYETFGTWRLALAAYNAGPGAVAQYRGVPPFAETQNYVQVIWGN